jgi:hypothetical protein
MPKYFHVSLGKEVTGKILRWNKRDTSVVALILAFGPSTMGKQLCGRKGRKKRNSGLVAWEVRSVVNSRTRIELGPFEALWEVS